MKAKEKTKALVLFSGGLDSRLVVRLLQEQNLGVECLYFKLPFGCGCCNDSQCNFNFSQLHGVKLTILDCTKGKLFQEYLKIIRNPKFGRGSSMNPCIDCKVFMFKKAKAYADEHRIKIIATGEVLGERPMSQTSGAMKKIDKELGFELLRPLSAKLLEETQAEKKKLVDRTRFLDIQGRQRKTQFELAKKFDIKFPNPGGGCLLCEKAYMPRLKDMLGNYKKISSEQLKTLENFRHFRVKGKIILGRNHQENILLQELNKRLKYNIIVAPFDRPGPTAIYENIEDRAMAEKLQKTYSTKDLKEREQFKNITL
jgi:tRNA-specific 2-thiouridylase